MERLIRKNENNQEQTDNIPFFKSGQTLSSLKSRSTSSQPDNARDLGKKKDSDAMSEYRDSSDMNEGKYNRAPLKPHDCYTVADVGAPDMDIDLDMALHVDGRGSEGLTRLGERAEEDGRERGNGKAEREESQEAEGEAAAEAEGERAAERVDNEEVNSFNSDQPWNWWSMEILDETVKLKERQEHADAGHKASVADRLLAAWTTVKLVI